MPSLRSLLFLLPIPFALMACAADDASLGETDDELRRFEDAHWVYDGPLSALENPQVTVSLRGHTARLTGTLAGNVDLSALPHARTTLVGTRTRVDIVYPIATGEKASYNSTPSVYKFQDVRPYRPDSYVVNEFGRNLVPWGGFPFLNYNSGVALHGPISSTDSKGAEAIEVFYLRRGKVSHGCNRMLGEHVTELTHALGTNMRKLYEPGRAYTPRSGASVTIVADFDRFGDKAIDVDYPTDVTDTGTIRPAPVVGAANVAMFGSWIASELPNGADLPPDLKWEAGKRGDYYVFSEHVKKDWVCSIPKKSLDRARAFAQRRGGELPKGFCAKKACILSALDAGKDVKATCGI